MFYTSNQKRFLTVGILVKSRQQINFVFGFLFKLKFVKYYLKYILNFSRKVFSSYFLLFLSLFHHIVAFISPYCHFLLEHPRSKTISYYYFLDYYFYLNLLLFIIAHWVNTLFITYCNNSITSLVLFFFFFFFCYHCFLSHHSRTVNSLTAWVNSEMWDENSWIWSSV